MLAAILLFIPNVITAQNPQITYELSMPKPSNHLFEVSISFENLPAADTYLELTLPVWRPGRYLIFDFASGVQEFSADGPNGKPLQWKKINKNTWRINAAQERSVSVGYKVYADEFNLRTRGLNSEHGFVDGTSVFMYSEEYRSLPLKLKVNPYRDWHVTTGMESADNEPNTFSAPNYDYFVDCPLEIGNQRDIEFTVSGTNHIFSIQGEAEFNKDSLLSDLRKIIKMNLDFWGSIPYEKYVFIVHCSPQSSGGTEHHNSSVLGVRPSAFETAPGYKGFLRLVSHEFFHTWNVKQFRPAGITPYDYSKENYTEELWLAEGGTSYYDGLLLLRTKQIELQDFFDEIKNAVQEERRRPGNRVQSLAESSFDAWIKFWKGTPQRYNTETDYYGKGSSVCLILDLEMRNRTNSRHSLDDVFKQMFKRYRIPAPSEVGKGDAGYTNADFIKVCEELSGTDFRQFFDDYLYGTKQIEWEKYLSHAGLELRSEDSTIVPVVGIITEQRGDRILVKQMLSGSASENAGLSVGDELIALDDERISYEGFDEKLDNYETGDTLTVTVFRNDKLLDFNLILQDKKVANYYVVKTSNPSALQKSIYESWLNTEW
jgi:predicted metalloprotease with PDZ domain